jgi:PiT family inorganic phosphate transporter
MTYAIIILIIVIAAALAFEYINGFHDAANAIATVVSTKVLSPRVALLYGAILNFFGAFFGTHVAKTIGSGIVDKVAVTQEVILCALLGAIIWNLLTWFFGIPSSSSHALIGGLLGAAIAHNGFGIVQLDGLINKVIIPMFTSPLIGFCLGFSLMLALLWMFAKASPEKINKQFKRLQVFSAGIMAFSHGSNDAQKIMGIITLSLITFSFVTLELKDKPVSYDSHTQQAVVMLEKDCYAATRAEALTGDSASMATMIDYDRNTHLAEIQLSNGEVLKNIKIDNVQKDFIVPTWVIFICAVTMGLGTMAGGWKIIRTLGDKVLKLKPIHGFAAETTAATTILTASYFGIPVSTTHIISTAIMGVGSTIRFSAVKWGLVGNIVLAWFLTIPVCAILAAVLYKLCVGQ